MGMGSSGGGSAGEVSYPDYMEDAHGDWLDNSGADSMTNSIVDLMNTAQTGNSPYSGFATVNPATQFGTAVLLPFTAVENLRTLDLDAIFDVMETYLNDDATLEAMVNASAAIQDARMVATVIPRFQAGMRDIGAVLTSAYAIGLVNIEAENQRNIDEFDAKLRMENRWRAWEIALQWTQLNVEFYRLCAAVCADVNRAYVEARYKYNQLLVEMSAKDRLFDLETYQYGSNVMASIAGATAVTKPETNFTQTALGNMLGMGAAGYMAAGASGGAIGGPAGAAIGAGLGLLLSFMQ